MNRIACVLFVLVPVAVLSLSRAEDKPPKAQDTPAKTRAAAPAVADRATLEKEFAESLSAATLVGYFTSDGQENGLKKEKYRLKNVKKLRGDSWLFEYQYGDKGAAIPLPLEVKWAGDTPVITLTDAKIPGVGTFTARVLFYRGEYAGTWSAGDHGGKLFGKIVKEDEEEKEDTGENEDTNEKEDGDE